MVKELNEKIFLYFQGKCFPSVSITGNNCDLKCRHCGGHFLKNMVNFSEKNSNFSFIDSLVSTKANGFLLSGGCDLRGIVPLEFAKKEIEYAVEKGLLVNAHPGLILDENSNVFSLGISNFSIEIHQDPDIIKNVFNLDFSPSDYEKEIDIFLNKKIKFTPHLCIGFGKYDFVASADLLLKKGIKNVVVNVLLSVDDSIVQISEKAIFDCLDYLIEKGFSVTLGCMRPHNYRNLEIEAIKKGIKKIANPSSSLIQFLKSNIYKIVERKVCCCFD